MIKQRDIRLLSVDELRALVNVVNNTNEHFNDPPSEVMDAQGILDLFWAAADHGWDGFDEFWKHDREAALAAWHTIQAERKGARR